MCKGLSLEGSIKASSFGLLSEQGKHIQKHFAIKSAHTPFHDVSGFNCKMHEKKTITEIVGS